MSPCFIRKCIFRSIEMTSYNHSYNYERMSKETFFLDRPTVAWFLSEQSRRDNKDKNRPMICMGALLEVLDFAATSAIVNRGIRPLRVVLLSETGEMITCGHRFAGSSISRLDFGVSREASIWEYNAPCPHKLIMSLTPVLQLLSDRILASRYMLSKEEEDLIFVVKIEGPIPAEESRGYSNRISDSTKEFLVRNRPSIIKAMS